MAQFAILMFETPGAWSALPEAERDRLMALYGAWVRDLRAAGAFVDGWPFGEAGCTLRGAPEGGVVATPGNGTGPVPTGLFLVEAPDLDAASRLARGCPALLHGETVSVRAIGHG